MVRRQDAPGHRVLLGGVKAMKLSPHLVLRVCFVLLLGVAAFGVFSNLPVIRRSPLVPAAGLAAPAEQPLRFVVVAPQYDHPFWLGVGRGARTAGERLGINVEFTGPRRASLEEQVQLLDQATAAQVDGILTQGVPDPRIARALAKAVDRGIPVITLETDLPDPSVRRLAYVGSDNYQAGLMAAKELLARTGGDAVVGIIRGNLGPEEEDLRVAGFRAGLKSAPGVRVAAVEPSELNRTVAGQKALKLIREHPAITAMYGTTALDAVGIAQSVTALGIKERILVLGWDQVGDTEDYLTRGAIDAVVDEDPQLMGRRAVEAMESYLRRDERPTGLLHTPFALRTGGGSR